MNIPTLAGNSPSTTYQKLVQTSGGYLADGAGNSIDTLNVTASYTGEILDKGIAQLSGGTVIIGSDFAYSTNIISLTYYSLDNTAATIGYLNVVDGVSFTINSTNITDTNKVSWIIFQG